MAEVNPPHADIHPWRVLFLIPKELPPVLADKKKWSLNFHHFLSLCLKKLINQRPTAEELLQHPFVLNCKRKSTLVQIIDECQNVIDQRGFGLYRSDDDEGLMPTGEDNPNELKSPPKGNDDKGDPLSRNNKPSPQPFGHNDFQKLCQDNTIQLPWLNLNYISPLSLVTPTPVAQIASSISELSHTNTSSVISSNVMASGMALNPYLTNLLKTYAHHHHKQETVPMTAKQIDETERVANELSATLKTILRL